MGSFLMEVVLSDFVRDLKTFPKPEGLPKDGWYVDM
jgi:hypothetical protein